MSARFLQRVNRAEESAPAAASVRKWLCVPAGGQRLALSFSQQPQLVKQGVQPCIGSARIEGAMYSRPLGPEVRAAEE